MVQGQGFYAPLGFFKGETRFYISKMCYDTSVALLFA